MARWIIYHNEIMVKTKHAYTSSHHHHRSHKPRQMKEALGGVHVNLSFLKSYDTIRYSHPWKDYCNNHLENPARNPSESYVLFGCVCAFLSSKYPLAQSPPLRSEGIVIVLAYHQRSRQETHQACQLCPGRWSELPYIS